MKVLIFLIGIILFPLSSHGAIMIPDSPNVDITISGTGWSEAVAKTLQAYIDARYSELNDKIPESGNWEYTLKIKKVYSDESITSLLITQYEYMG
jgi:hypothetical protein